MRTFRLSYGALFIIGGAAFAVVSYFVGSWLYSFELYVWGAVAGVQSPWDLMGDLLTAHPITFFPWILGTTLIAYVLGRFFDREVQMRHRLEGLAVTDELTLVYNHRFFMQQLSNEIKRTNRMARAFALLLMDIDDFKQFNDSRGHLAGNDALRLVAAAIRGSVRDTDTVARYGGEEFVVIASGASAADGVILAERIRRRVETTALVTVSIGVGGFPEHADSMHELIGVVDKAMYQAKRSGKNQVYLTETPFPAEAGGMLGARDQMSLGLESMNTDTLRP